MAWNPDYITVNELASWQGNGDPVADLVELSWAVTTASRAVDRHCYRQFGSATGSRFYVPEYHRDRWYVDIDDTFSTTPTVEVDRDDDGVWETEITFFKLLPLNAAADGKPYTMIEVPPRYGQSLTNVQPNRFSSVKVTATFGWASVPPAIKLATLLTASRLYARRESVYGPLSGMDVDDVSLKWAANATLDPDVSESISSYVRRWSAV